MKTPSNPQFSPFGPIKCREKTLIYTKFLNSKVCSGSQIILEHSKNNMIYKTSQELRMLSSVTINCQVTKIVMNSGSQLSELGGVLKCLCLCHCLCLCLCICLCHFFWSCHVFSSLRTNVSKVTSL